MGAANDGGQVEEGPRDAGGDGGDETKSANTLLIDRNNQMDLALRDPA
jgi:hypothetical protein